MWILLTLLCSTYTRTSPTASPAINSVTFPLGPSVRRGRLTDIKKNQSPSSGLAMEWNGAAGPQWACGSFHHTGSMPGWHRARRVSSQLGRMEGGDQWGGREEGEGDLRRADRECPTHYRMTSSHRSPGNGIVTGSWDVGEGVVENVTEEGQTVKKELTADWTLVTLWFSGYKILEVPPCSSLYQVVSGHERRFRSTSDCCDMKPECKNLHYYLKEKQQMAVWNGRQSGERGAQPWLGVMQGWHFVLKGGGDNRAQMKTIFFK